MWRLTRLRQWFQSSTKVLYILLLSYIGKAQFKNWRLFGKEIQNSVKNNVINSERIVHSTNKSLSRLKSHEEYSILSQVDQKNGNLIPFNCKLK